MSEIYFEKVRESVIGDVVHALRGGRNEVLNKAAFTLGRHAHLAPGLLDKAIVDLHGAAKQVGVNEPEI